MNSEKYNIDIYEDGAGIFSLSIKFKISSFDDFGEYECTAANIYGKDTATVKLLGCSSILTHSQLY